MKPRGNPNVTALVLSCRELQKGVDSLRTRLPRDISITTISGDGGNVRPPAATFLIFPYLWRAAFVVSRVFHFVIFLSDKKF